MPVRRLSVGSRVSADGLRPSALVRGGYKGPFEGPFLSSALVFALLAAAGGTAVAKDSGKPAPRNDTTEVEVEVEGPPEDRRPPAEVKPHEASPPPAPVPLAETAPVPLGPTETVGFSDRLFVRSPGDEVVVFPGARVQVDGAAFPRQTPKSGVYLRRARVELTGWLGRIFYFDASADFAPAPPPDSEPLPPSALPATDNYVALAPFGDRFILQAGQFDAPFTLENRTSDAYTTFLERSMAVRSLGAPRNKEVGAMVHGLLADGVFYYSAGIFNGDGPDFRNFDNQPDAIGRATITPFAGREGSFRRLSLGGSGWYGRHVLGPTFPTQATPGGLPFLAPTWLTGQPSRTLELREHGYVAAFGGELSLPLGTHFGLRGEGVFKRQQLAETDSVSIPGQVMELGSATLTGIAGYG